MASEPPAKKARSDPEAEKMRVGFAAVDRYVTSGMVVGLGTGSTAAYAVQRLGEKLAAGDLTDIVAIPTSERTREQAEALGIPLSTIDEHPHLDVAIDGADAVDPALNLVKGGGGALLREKMVEVCAAMLVIIVDGSKPCDALGPSFPIPVEVTQFAVRHVQRAIEALPSLFGLGAEARLRRGSASNNKPDGDAPAVTENGNYIVDVHLARPLDDVKATAAELTQTIGVVEHGLFVGMAKAVLVAQDDGEIGIMANDDDLSAE